MNKKLLCAALFCGLGVAHVASAQEFDDRWYVTGSVGYNFQDSDRNTKSDYFGAIGVGKFLSPNWSLDGEINYQNPNFEDSACALGGTCKGRDLNWSQYGISFDLRRYWGSQERGWNPYALLGLGYQQSDEEYNAFPNPDSPGQRDGGKFAAKGGLGVMTKLGPRVGFRTELAYRYTFDNDSVAAPNESGFGDILASVGIVIPLGPEPTVAVMAPVAPSCADMDSDGDGVNDCDDKCPDSQAGQTIGPDGCPVPVSIDLKGVNFDFDKATLRPDAVAILNEAVQIMQRYPDLRAEVAGHTDLCGSDAYNQKLSERRAQAVYSYLTSNGVDAGHLTGPVGYGESRPLEQTPQTFPACKSETNRRTELNVQQ